jgi:hypothetical protein
MALAISASDDIVGARKMIPEPKTAQIPSSAALKTFVFVGMRRRAKRVRVKGREGNAKQFLLTINIKC